jgi:hypothetical protein
MHKAEGGLPFLFCFRLSSTRAVAVAQSTIPGRLAPGAQVPKKGQLHSKPEQKPADSARTATPPAATDLPTPPFLTRYILADPYF